MELNYVNSTMEEINSLTDELYEALMDKEFDLIDQICIKLSQGIRDVKRSCNEYKTIP
jgi:uncharacterized protein (UPF0297 family)